VPVARLKWNDEYAPDGWDYPTYDRFNGGRPDVVFMAHSPGAEDSSYKPGEGVQVQDYDEASTLVANFIKRTKNSR
jgi:hypothetical protein